jgi:hypothetical protein
MRNRSTGRHNCASATLSATKRNVGKILIWETEVLEDKTVPVPLNPPQIALFERHWYENPKYWETKLSQWHFVHHKSHYLKDTDMRNRSTGRQNCPSATLSATNSIIGKILIWESEVLGDKTVPVPLYPPQIPLFERYWYEKPKYWETKLSQWHFFRHKSHYLKDTDMRNRSTRRQNCPSATLCATNRTIWKILLW